MAAHLRLAVAVLFVAMATGACPERALASRGAQAPTIEYDVKAAFLVNFARYVEWPAGIRRGQPFSLCTLEPDPFGRRLEAAVSGEVWEGRPIAVRRLANARDLSDCHLLYVPAASAPAFHTARDQALSQSVLTVGEPSDFLESGGVIRLIVERNKVRFAINQAAADAAGLRISSRLLRLAQEVVQRRPQ